MAANIEKFVSFRIGQHHLPFLFPSMRPPKWTMKVSHVSVPTRRNLNSEWMKLEQRKSLFTHTAITPTSLVEFEELTERERWKEGVVLVVARLAIVFLCDNSRLKINATTWVSLDSERMKLPHGKQAKTNPTILFFDATGRVRDMRPTGRHSSATLPSVSWSLWR